MQFEKIFVMKFKKASNLSMVYLLNNAVQCLHTYHRNLSESPLARALLLSY